MWSEKHGEKARVENWPSLETIVLQTVQLPSAERKLGCEGWESAESEEDKVEEERREAIDGGVLSVLYVSE